MIKVVEDERMTFTIKKYLFYGDHWLSSSLVCLVCMFTTLPARAEHFVFCFVSDAPNSSLQQAPKVRGSRGHTCSSFPHHRRDFKRRSLPVTGGSSSVTLRVWTLACGCRTPGASCLWVHRRGLDPEPCYCCFIILSSRFPVAPVTPLVKIFLIPF